MDGVTNENIFAERFTNPVEQFFVLLFEIWQQLPATIQFMISMILGVTVFFGIIQMIRT